MYRLHEARRRAGMAERIRLDVRAFPLELFNRRPTPKHVLDAEMVAAGSIEPGAGWQMWLGPSHEYPVTMLPPMEAVEAAKEQGLGASEALDRALRHAFFAESRCISMRHVILEVARTCDGLDGEKLAEALDDGRARRAVVDHKRQAEEGGVKGSPHFFLPDGSDAHNPGIRHHWEGEPGRGFPVVDSDDPEIYDDIVGRAVL